jgi:hypothetical protein
MAWTISSVGPVGSQPITNLDTTAQHKVGTIIQAVDPTYGAAEFMYIKGVASAADKSWVTINMDDGTCTLLAANAIGPVGVCVSALTASYYGWVQINGKALGKCLTSFADNGRVYATATAGSVDDASVAGDVVLGAKGASTTTADSGYAEFEIHRPFIQDRVSIIS